MTYNNLQNEGGEGYNPNAATERAAAEQRKVDACIQRRNDSVIAAGFRTPEIVHERRAAWNARVKAGEFGRGKANMSLVQAAERAQGWTVTDMRNAMAMYGIK